MIDKLKYPLLLLIALIVAVLLYGFSANRASKRLITTPIVKFNDYSNPILSENTVLELIELSSLDSLKVDELDILSIENKVLGHPLVDNAEVSMDLLGNTLVSVRQKKAVLRIMDSVAGYLDSDYNYMPLSKEHTPRVPLINGYTDQHHAPVVKLLEFLKTDDYLSQEVTQINIVDRDKFEIRVRSGNYSLRIGRVNNLSQKFLNYKALLAGLQPEELTQLKTIDLRFKGQVVTTNI